MWNHLHWADKAGLVAALSFAACIGLLDLMILAAVAVPGYWRFDIVLASWSLYATAAMTLPIWIGLRVIDAIMPIFRRARRSYRVHRNWFFESTGLKARFGWQ